MFGKAKIAALLAEFLGTAVLTLALLTVVIRTSFPFFPAVAAGTVVGVLVLVLGKFSGAHFNPAVTLGLWSQGKMQTTQTVVFVAAQLLGAIFALRLGEYLVNQSLPHLAEWGLDIRVLVAEMVGTFVFTFGIAAAVNQLYEGGKLAVAVGGSLAIGILVASLGSNGILNPAVALGLYSISWAYAVGPLLGGVLGMTTYSLLFADSTKKKSKK